MNKATIGVEACEEFMKNYQKLDEKLSALKEPIHAANKARAQSDAHDWLNACQVESARMLGSIGIPISYPDPKDIEFMDNEEFERLPIKKALDSLWKNGSPMFQPGKVTKDNYIMMTIEAANTISTAMTGNSTEVPYIQKQDGSFSAITPAFDANIASTRPPFYKRWFQAIVPKWKNDINEYNTARQLEKRSNELEGMAEGYVQQSAGHQGPEAQNRNENTDENSRRRTNLNELGGAQMSQNRQNGPERGNNNAREPLSRQGQARQSQGRGRH